MPKKIAVYIRTSSSRQQASSQYSLLDPNGDYEFFEDFGQSGMIKFEQRPAAKKLMQAVQRGRIGKIIVARMDRVSRSTSDLLYVVDKISIECKVPIESSQEKFITLEPDGTMSPIAGIVLHFLSIYSNQVYEEIRQKTALGRQRAKELGKYKGRSKDAVETPEKFLSKTKPKKIADLLKAGASVRSICRVVEVSTASVYKVKHILEHKQAA